MVMMNVRVMRIQLPSSVIVRGRVLVLPQIIDVRLQEYTVLPRRQLGSKQSELCQHPKAHNYVNNG
jgi:hypothetical protein